MLTTANLRQERTTDPAVFAFHITGEITGDEMERMAETMNAAFDRHDKVSMLLIFDAYDGSEAGASLNWDSIKSRFRSITKVDKYAVVGAPDAARSMIEGMDKIIPVDARTFDHAQIDAAWDFVGAKPA